MNYILVDVGSDKPPHIAMKGFPVCGNCHSFSSEQELPGANLDDYVQSNAFWTPDGKEIIFSRAPALPREDDQYKLTVEDPEMLDQFEKRGIPFKYDLYRIPFNDGKGGLAEPVKGASDNAKSNYFPAVSPDGKWLVFVSKGLSIYTDLFLTHIDEKGNSSIPVVIDRAREYQRVCNYPEFLNRKPGDEFVMEYDYVELAHIKNALREGRSKRRRTFMNGSWIRIHSSSVRIVSL